MQLLDFDTLQPEILQALHYPDLSHEWFITPFWETALYVQAARAGLISICWQPGSEAWLAAQLQTEYAVLEWPDRHISRNLRRQLRRSDPVLAGTNLRLTTVLDPVIAGIRNRFDEECWLQPPYVGLLRELANSPQEGLQAIATELYGPDGDLWAGEVGYIIGRSYTCLTGFVANSASRGTSWGLVQILALSELLCRQGFEFMNMGHAMMAYKLDLGARVLGRLDFLARWLPAINLNGGIPLQLPVEQPQAVTGLLTSLIPG